jgi:uncharacterized protein involved in oxidation of intracellular sulfur
MANTLLILNDPPYGTERSYNALRLAGAPSQRDGEQVKFARGAGQLGAVGRCTLVF